MVALDRPWVGTHFDFQGFPITSQVQIEELRACCRSVFVDLEREIWTPAQGVTAHPLHGSTLYTDVVPVEKELPAARDIYRACECALDDLLAKISREGDLDAQALSSAMSAVVASIQRSPGALLLLSAVRREDSYGLARAMDTAILMVAFGRFLQYPAPRLAVLGLAGVLLDVGMTMLPHAVVHALGADEVVDDGLIETHVLHSVELIRSARALPGGVDEVVLLHHERQDGEGYPYGLAGDQIYVDGALAAVVDSYSKLPRPKGGHMSASRALNLLHKQRGHALHEGLVEKFIQCIGVYPVGSAVEMKTGEAGRVIAQDPVRRLSPRVMVRRDPAGIA